MLFTGLPTSPGVDAPALPSFWMSDVNPQGSRLSSVTPIFATRIPAAIIIFLPAEFPQGFGPLSVSYVPGFEIEPTATFSINTGKCNSQRDGATPDLPVCAKQGWSIASSWPELALART